VARVLSNLRYRQHLFFGICRFMYDLFKNGNRQTLDRLVKSLSLACASREDAVPKQSQPEEERLATSYNLLNSLIARGFGPATFGL
jgi:hypothetical protein